MKQKPYHIDLTPMTSYLMGYVVGYIYPHDGSEWLCCNKDGKCCCNDYRREYEYNPLIYKTPEAARTVAEKIAKISSWKVFYRPYKYQSAIPKHAKGMQPWTGKILTVFIEKP